MTLPLTILIIGFVVGQAVLLGYLVMQRDLPSSQFRNLVVMISLALVTSGLLLLPMTANRDLWVWLGIGLTTLALGTVALGDVLQAQRPAWYRNWLVAGGVWLLVLAGFVLLGDAPFTGWAGTEPGLGIWIALLGLALILAPILALYIQRVRQATMPEIGNRALMWCVVIGLYSVAAVLLGSGTMVLMPVGALLLLVTTTITTYAYYRYRVFNVRYVLSVLGRFVTFMLVAWALIFAVLYVAQQLMLRRDDLSTLVTLALMALLVAAALLPLRQIVDFVWQALLKRRQTGLAMAAAHYSRQVATASTLEDVVTATTETLNRTLGAQQSALILVSNAADDPDKVQFVVLDHDHPHRETPRSMGLVGKSSPIFYTLAARKVPLGQYDIDYGPAYLIIPDEEREFFKGLDLLVYTPVVAENRLIAVVAAGAKQDATPYERDDLDMLLVIAQQVGMAMRSARLISDLQQLNDNMRVLNKRLEAAKSDLQKLDSVKSDFITIASHELRTPLAQLRGYTDIIDSLNQAEALKKDQTAQMVANLRRSTERMEELISAMLDVSQLDVNAMDLRFVRTTPESLVRLALDPLKEVLSQRNIMLEIADLSGLPYMHADMQRLVQAFRNVFVNAIKFTPDGGTIMVRAQAEGTTETSLDTILFAIQDTGVGIAAKDIEYIFQKFYRGFDTQLHSTGMYKFMGAGPGLGLTIAKGIIEGHTGQIWAESSGHDMKALPGSTFFIRLPLNPPEGPRRVQPFERSKQVKLPDDARPATNASKPAANGDSSNTQNNDVATQGAEQS